MKHTDIIDAYNRIRKIDNTIPDEVLNFMKETALRALGAAEPGVEALAEASSFARSAGLVNDLKMLANISRATGWYDTADWLDEQINNYEFFKKQYESARKK